MTTIITLALSLVVMTIGFVLKQALLLICAGLGWLVFGVLIYTSASSQNVALFVLGLALALVCFIWPISIWMRTRTGRLSPEERDQAEYKQQVLDKTRRRY